MKKLIVSALFISVFFIGISALITGVSAKLGSGEKATELIRASRIALGGNQNLVAVKSMTIKASTTHFFEKNGVQDVKQGNLEINFELPGKFTKKVMIGAPGEGDPDSMVEKDVEVIVRGGDGSTVGTEDGKDNVFFIRKSEDSGAEWTTDDGSDVKTRVRIKKPDGTVEDVDAGGRRKVIVRTENNGAGNGENEWVTEDGKNIRVKKLGSGSASSGSSEMLRMTVALLMTAPDDGSVSYKFLGQGDVDGFASNIIGVESNGKSFKLFLDAGSNLPRMISYEGDGPHRIIIKKDNEVVQENIVGSESERQIKFSDFRSVGNLLLPHRWTEVSNGKAMQNIDVTSFEINPADIAERLGTGNEGGQRVIVRKKMNR